MSSEQAYLSRIEYLFDHGTITGLDEGQLLERYIAGRDESALEALIERHGPMVMGVCRRRLGDPHDADDAFQATFLILIRKARRLRDYQRLGPWLHGVAYRVAARSRADATRRRVLERSGARAESDGTAQAPDRLASRTELCFVIDEEIARLPASHRAAIVACDLEGQSQSDAARSLGWTEGAVRGKLARARKKLRARLVRRGVAPTFVTGAAPLIGREFAPSVPSALVHSTTRAATATLLAGRALPLAGAAVSTSVSALVQGVLRAMTISQLGIVTCAAILASTAILSVGGLVSAALMIDESPTPRAVTRNEQPEVKVKRPLRVRGSVVDAATGEPIKRFRIIPGEINGATRFYWSRGEAIPGSNGRLDVTPFRTVRPPVPSYVRIEADGYVPVNSSPIEKVEGEVTLIFKLQKGSGLGGIVRLQDGRPASGAEVRLFNENIRLPLRNGRLPSSPAPGQAANAWQTRTDDAGRFGFQPQDEPFRVMVLHDQGYAQRSEQELARSSEITLEPWSRIEGTLLIGSQFGAGQSIRVQLERTSFVPSGYEFYQYETRTDDSGRFTVERLMAGEAQVFRATPSKQSKGLSYPSDLSVSTGFPFEINSAKTITLRAGGRRRPVTGRVAINTVKIDQATLPGSAGRIEPYSLLGRLHRKQADMPEPRDYASWDAEKRKTHAREWYLSAEGRAARRERWLATFAIDSDHRFRIDDVEPGAYTLYVEPIDQRLRGVLTREIQVPPLPGDRSDVPLDLGTLPISLDVVRNLAIGQPAPAFEIKSLNGKPLRLGDFNGKFVILDFWATWCGPCLEQEPHLQAVFDAFHDDDRFAIVSLSLDDKPETAANYVAKHNLKWHQGFLGQGSRVSEQYGITSIPQIMLIGPDGKIVSKDLGGPGIKTAVSQALRRLP